MFYDVLKSGMHHYKETEGGRATVCKAIELYGEQRELAGKKWPLALVSRVLLLR